MKLVKLCIDISMTSLLQQAHTRNEARVGDCQISLIDSTQEALAEAGGRAERDLQPQRSALVSLLD